MKKSKYYLIFLTVLAALVISSFVFVSCPPVDEEPVSNTIVVTGDLTSSKWNKILDEIYSNGIFVNLDLSACTIPASGDEIFRRTHENGHPYTYETRINEYDDYYQFNPTGSTKNGKEYIISIILPDIATMINNISDNMLIESLEDLGDDEIEDYAFNHFTRLKSVSGKRIRLIGTFAFYNCTSLVEVQFPSANIAMQYSFYNCTSIKKLELEKMQYILPRAFENCTSLERVEFHVAREISQGAFKNCKNITEISFAKAMLIGPEAFRDCSKLRKARFHVEPGRSGGGHPLDSWRNPTPQTLPYDIDSVAFHMNAFRGCTSLELLDVQFAWNVFFGAGALSDIGTSLDLILFDDNGVDKNGKTYGHPQVELILGKRLVPDDELEDDEKDLDIGRLTLKELRIIAPPVFPLSESQIMFKDNKFGAVGKAEDGFASIRNKINATYNSTDRYKDYNEPKKSVVKVTLNGRPTLADITN